MSWRWFGGAATEADPPKGEPVDAHPLCIAAITATVTIGLLPLMSKSNVAQVAAHDGQCADLFVNRGLRAAKRSFFLCRFVLPSVAGMHDDEGTSSASRSIHSDAPPPHACHTLVEAKDSVFTAYPKR